MSSEKPPENPAAKPAVVVVSSLVARGGVGLRATAFSLERLGFPVWQVPTIFLPWHTGHSPSTKIVPSDALFTAAIEDLAGSAHLAEVGAVVSGYIGDAAQAAAIEMLVTAVKRTNPSALYVCDPVIGDAEGLYVAEATATTIRDRLLPLADAATPNRYELAWLTGRETDTPAKALAAARALGPARVVVTSAPALMRGQIAMILAAPDGAFVAEHPLVDGPSSGPGDLVSGLFTAGLLSGGGSEQLLKRTAAGTFEVIAVSAKAAADEMLLVAAQDRFVHPMAHISVRRMVEAGAAAR